MRAVLCTASISNKRDIVIQLLYFCTVAAADIKDASVIVGYCLAAYQALGWAHQNYAVPCSNEDTFLVCEKVNDDCGGIRFPIPQLKPCSTNKSSIIGQLMRFSIVLWASPRRSLPPGLWHKSKWIMVWTSLACLSFWTITLMQRII